MNLKKINFKQPKYILPAIIYLPIIGLGWLIIDLFNTGKAEVPNGLETTEYINPNLPEAKVKGDGIGGKYDNMAKSWGKIQDYSAVETIEQGETDITEEYNSKYSDEDLAYLDAMAEEQAKAEMERLRSLQESLERSAIVAEQGTASGEPYAILSEEERLLAANQRQQESLDELGKALEQARAQVSNEDRVPSERDIAVHVQTQETVESPPEVQDKAVEEIPEDAKASKMVKKFRETSSYFNTIAENEAERNLIKAIIDEDIKAVEGSRVRLRLLDDVEIDGTVVKKGSYIYAIMSGFGSQRVKGSVQSMLVSDELVKVSLTLYDTDGLEGLYVPQSSFRETTKDIASGAMSNAMTINGGSYGSTMAQWGMQTLQNSIQKGFSAASKAIRKNKAKLKYGTFVYLVNGREKRE